MVAPLASFSSSLAVEPAQNDRSELLFYLEIGSSLDVDTLGLPDTLNTDRNTRVMAELWTAWQRRWVFH
jgi:hypothetical protein